MQVSSVAIRKIINEERLKAIVSVTFDGMFAVHDIKIIHGEKGLFLAMPSKKFGEGNYKDIVHPTNLEMRKMLEEEVINAYQQQLEELEQSQVQEETTNGES